MKNNRSLCTALLALCLMACSTPGPMDHKREAAGEGSWEERLARLDKAAQADVKLRGELYRQRELAVNEILAQADQLRREGIADQALGSYQRVLKIDPSSRRARDGVAALEVDKRHRALVQKADAALKQGKLDEVSDLLAGVLKENPNQREARALSRRVAEAQAATKDGILPRLNAALTKPVTMEFRDAALSAVFELLSRTAGVNFVFDRDVRPDVKVNIFVRDTSVEDVIKIVLLTNQLERKVLNDNTVLIYPNTPAKIKDYQDLVVRSFYLGNSDPKQVLAMLKTLIRARDVYIDEKLNLLVMRDTPQAIKLAEKLVLTQDLAEPEVVLELEVLEVGQRRVQDLGIRYPESVSLGDAGTATTDKSIYDLSRSSLRAWTVNPLFIANLKKQDTDTRVLANPRIRVKNREKAKIHVGEKVPVVTSTSTANVGVSSSVSYIDVGLKLDVEPNVYLDDDIAIKVNLEVSNILEQVTFKDALAFRLGTRNATTSLRLRDGETQILAGLINDEDRRTTNKVPGLGDLPILGRLFGTRNTNRDKSEVVLLITPRVVRNLVRPEAVEAELYSGTDAVAGNEPLRLRPSAPGSIAVAPATGGGVVGAPGPTSANPSSGANVPAPQIPQPSVHQITMTVPPNAKPGQEFVVGIKLPFAVSQGQLQVAFDWKAITFVGGSVPVQAVPGLVAVLIDNSTPAEFSGELVFKVNDKAPDGPTQITLDGAQFFDEEGQLFQGAVSGPSVVTIQKGNGK